MLLIHFRETPCIEFLISKNRSFYNLLVSDNFPNEDVTQLPPFKISVTSTSNLIKCMVVVRLKVP